MPRKKQSFLISKNKKIEDLFSNCSSKEKEDKNKEDKEDKEEEDNNKEDQSQTLNNSITISLDSEQNIEKTEDDSDYDNEGEELENDESFEFNNLEKDVELMGNNRNKRCFTHKKKK